MNTDVFNLRNFHDNNDNNIIDIAFPMFAVECEISLPVENEIDVYEEAILKLLSIKLAKNSIRAALNITHSLNNDIFSSLESRGHIEKIDKEYQLTSRGIDVINNKDIINDETESKYGYMLVNAIKKEPLWYFFEGDIFNSFHSDYAINKNKLTIKGNEKDTFASQEISSYQLEKAFYKYCRILEMQNKKFTDNSSGEKNAVLFADIESDFSEIDFRENSRDKSSEPANNYTSEKYFTKKANVRQLKTKKKPLYLQMQLIIDPSFPGGYRVESPLMLNGDDNDLFLRQIQWIKHPMHDVYIGEKNFSNFLINEVNKLLPSEASKIDSSNLIINKMPHLYKEKDRYGDIYNDICEIFDLSKQKNLSLTAKGNIVSNFSSKLIEKLLNKLIMTVPHKNFQETSTRAFYDFKNKNEQEQEKIIEQFAQILGVKRDVLPKGKVFFSAIKNFKFTYGNSIREKLLNLIVLYYYQPSAQITGFFRQLKPSALSEYIKNIFIMSKIRNSVSHDATDRTFSEEDYNFFVDHIYGSANILFEALKEDV